MLPTEEQSLLWQLWAATEFVACALLLIVVVRTWAFPPARAEGVVRRATR